MIVWPFKTFYTFPMRYIFVLSFLCVFILTSYAAQARTQFPEFSLGGTLPNVEQENVTIDAFEVENPLMQDMLLLQEQINILEAMVERQSEIKKIADSYENVGLEFVQPAPARSICQKVPVNLPCLYAYPDLQKNESMIGDHKARVAEQQQRQMEEAIEQVLNNMSQPSASDLNMQDIQGILPNNLMTVEDRLLWSDIQCFLGKCSALIVSTLDENKRYRVSQGDMIDGEVKIVGINAGGVKVSAQGETHFLKPVGTTTDNGQSNPQRPSVIAGLLEQQMQNIQPVPTNPQDNGGDILQGLEAPTDTMDTSEDTAQQQQFLGPTGLF